MKTQDIQTYYPKPKQYCCLYHFMEGKKTKGITPCNNHVSLGVINPLTSLTGIEMQKVKKGKISNKFNNMLTSAQAQNLVVNADQYDMNFHTHFMNEIQKKGSLPRALTNPRLYVEKIIQKNYFNKNQSFLYPKNQNKKSFEQIYKLFKKFAQNTNFKTQKQLKQDIIRFSRQNNIKTSNITSLATINIDKNVISQYLFSKEDFIQYLISHKFSQEESEIFWETAYNKNLFLIAERTQSNLAKLNNEFLSMKAFTYNYKKFYLEEQEYYKNVFSEPAFRQRLIDLRIALQPWFHKNIILKHNMQKWKKNQLQVAEFIKNAGYQKQFEQLIKLIQDRNRIYFLMRSLGKSIFTLTDQKNFGMDAWNNRITYLIEQKSDSLICFMEFIQKFKENLINLQIQHGRDVSRFQITDLIEFLTNNKESYSQMQQTWLIKWIRNIYKYLLFYKQQKDLYIDQDNLKLSVKSSIVIQKQLIQQFIFYKSNQTDSFLQILTNLTEQIEEKLFSMPQLQGRKKYLVECNYLAETLLRIIRRNNFGCFQSLYLISKTVEDHWYDFENCIEQVVDLIRKSSNKQKDFNIDDKFWKQIFTFQGNHKQNLNKTQEQQNINSYNYKDAFDKYKNVKNALGIVNSKVNNVNQIQKENKPNKKGKEMNKLSNKSAQFLNKIKRQKGQVKQKVDQFDWDLGYKRHERQSCSNGYCSLCNDVVSTEISSTISKVQDMQNYLMSLLNDI